MKTKCCSHCSLTVQQTNEIKFQASTEKKIKDTSAQTEDQQVEPIMEAQREPIAYEIPLTSNCTKTSLQEALKKRRPDFLSGSEIRRKAIQDMAHLRLVDKVDTNSIPRLFTYQQMRKNTEKLYRQLPEVQTKIRNVDRNRKDMIISNRIKANLFQKVNPIISNIKY